MSRKHSIRRRTLIVTGCLVFGIATFLGIRTYQDLAARERVASVLQSGEVPVSIRSLSRSSGPADRARAKRLETDYDAWMAKVIARNPGLEPKWKTVGDEKNGFLQWLDLSERYQNDHETGSDALDLPEGLKGMIGYSEPWDHDLVAAGLADYEDLLGELTRIALLPDNSAAGIPVERYSFIPAAFAKQCSDLLLADARLAAEDGDAERSLERARAVMGIAGIHSEIETPTLLMETVSILIRLGLENVVTEHILPDLKPTPEPLARWSAALEHDGHQPAHMAKLLRGEAYVSIRGLVIPLLVGDQAQLSKKEIPDPAALLDAMAQGQLKAVGEISSATVGQLYSGAEPSPFVTPSHLSPGAKEAYSALDIGLVSWSKGWARAASVHTRTRAALAILSGTEVPVEPITGLPFDYDPATRRLAHPKDFRLKDIAADPIILPDIEAAPPN